MEAWNTPVSFSRRLSSVLAAGAGLVMLFDVVRLWILPNSIQITFTDGFETAVALLCAVACFFASKRSSPFGKGLWLMAVIFFALLAVADGHDFLADISLSYGFLSSFAYLLGWSTYVPLALLIFFPIEKDGRPDWTWLSCLDFLLVTLAVVTAYFRLIYLPHAIAGKPWSVAAHADTVRDVLISLGLLLRAAVDPSPEARAFYRRIGGVFAGMTLLQPLYFVNARLIYVEGRPALFLLLALTAFLWKGAEIPRAEQGSRYKALQLFLGLSAAVTMVAVVIFAMSAPAAYYKFSYAVVGISLLLFVLRTALAERTRRAAETLLQDSERDYRDLFERAVVPIVIVDPESKRILQANSAACELYGFLPDNLVGWSMKNFETDVAACEAHLGELLRFGTSAPFESLHRTREGKEIEVLISTSVIQHRGRAAVLCFVRDMTERRQAMERFSLAFNASPEPISISTLSDGIYIDVNEAFLRITGYSREEVLGHRLANLNLLRDKDGWMRLLEALKAGSVKDFEIEFVTKSREVRLASISTEVIEVDGQTCLLSVIKDITERRRAEVALGEFQARITALVECTGDMIWSVDTKEFRLLTFNSTLKRLFARTSCPGVHLGMTPQELLPSVVARRWCEYYRRALRGGAFTTEYKSDLLGRNLLVSFNLMKSGEKVFGISVFAKDNTERKKAEDALRLSEQRYKDFITHSADAVWRVELEKPLPCKLSPDDAVEHLLRHAYIAECNDALARIAGLSRADEVLGKRIGELVPQEDLGRIESFRQIVRQEWAAQPIQFETIDRAGNLKALERTVVPIIQDEEVVRIWGLTRDITGLRRAEDDRREIEERFRTIFESTDIGIAMVDVEGRLIHVNPALQRVLGYSEEELCSMAFSEYTYKEDREVSWKFYSELVKGKRGNYEIEKRYVRKDGGLVWGHLTVSLVRDHAGQPQYAVGMIKDITERKRAEEGLVRLRQAIDASGEVIFMTDCNGLITSINPEFTRVYGYTAAEVIGRQTPRILKSGERTEVDYAKFWKAILAKRPVRGDIINKTKQGRLVNMNSSVSAIIDNLGRIAGFVAIQRDITEKRQLEEQFRQAQKMEAIGRLAGGIAHDFNNLLTIINGYAQLLIDDATLEEARRTQLTEIRNAGERAASLTRRLLAFSRKQVLDPKVLDLANVVEGTHKMLSRLLGEDIELRIFTKGQLGRIKADATQIEQVILNLAVNARDAMPHGGSLSIEMANAVLDKSYASRHATVVPGRYVVLAVSDTGIGMDAKTLERIFEPFYTTKSQGKGTGLGLSTVFGIVKQSEGHINVYSEPGKGTTFKIYLKEIEGLAEEAEEPEAPRPPGGSETILLVEDEEAVRAIAAKVLKDYGYKVLESSSAEDAVRIGEEYEPGIDLLLTDVVMPGLSGRNVAEHLAFSRPRMKVLFMSGYTDDAILHHGVLEAGVAFMQKPFTPEGLAARVREVLDTRLI